MWNIPFIFVRVYKSYAMNQVVKTLLIKKVISTITILI